MPSTAPPIVSFLDRVMASPGPRHSAVATYIYGRSEPVFPAGGDPPCYNHADSLGMYGVLVRP